MKRGKGALKEKMMSEEGSPFKEGGYSQGKAGIDSQAHGLRKHFTAVLTFLQKNEEP